MMVVHSFDLWQKDVFFSSAEEVQKSADIMESAYRLWIREKKDELCNELKAALGTAKWQLEEFEKAIRLSHKQCGNDSILTRHKHFVSAIESQIYHVESSLQEAYKKNGEEPLRWVNLSEEESDDLAMFLSGSSQISPNSNRAETLDKVNCRKETSKEVNDSECVIDIEEKTAGTRRTWSSPNFNSLRIIVPGDDNGEVEEEEKEKLVSQIEATPKVKGTKPIYWMQRLPDHTKLFDRTGCFQNRISLPFTHPIKLTYPS